jgi:hypothetical protein
MEIIFKRKESKADTEKVNAVDSQKKKDALLERLNDLRRKIYSNPDFDDYIMRLENYIAMLRCMPDCSDLEAMTSIDSLLLAEIDDAIADCDNGNFETIGVSIDNILIYIHDRRIGKALYKNEQYCKLIAENNMISKELKRIDIKNELLENKRVELVAKYKDPNCKLDKIAIGNELLDIKEQQDKLEESMDNYTERLGEIDLYFFDMEGVKGDSDAHSKFDPDLFNF